VFQSLKVDTVTVFLWEC